MCRQLYQPSLQIPRYRRKFHLCRGALEEYEQLSFLRACLELISLLVMPLELLHGQRCSQGWLYRTPKCTYPRAGWDLHAEGDRVDILGSGTEILCYLSGACAFVPGELRCPEHEVCLNGIRCLLLSCISNSGLLCL